MPFSKLLPFLIVVSLILSACGPGQVFGPTQTPTSTFTPTITPTLTPTLTPTATSTPLPTATSTSLPGLGITDNELVDWAIDLNYTLNETIVDGLPVRRYISPEGYTILTLMGNPPFLEKVILEIDLAQENSFHATVTWIYVLEIASNRAGKPAADWVHDSYPKAVQSGREEKVFKNVNVVLEVDGNIFRLIIEPAIK